MPKTIRVLVVEDEPHIRTSLMNFLEDVGFDTLTSENAERTLEILNNTPVDVAVVDIRLPDMDGNSLMTKAHKIQPNIKFIIYTGSTVYELTQSIKRLGVTSEDVFYKPISDLNIIAAAIHRKMQLGGSSK